MSWTSYTTCHFCGQTVKKDVANTHQCPYCRAEEKICTGCGKTKKIYENDQYQFAYNISKDSLKFEDPFNDICQDCQQAKRQVVRDVQTKGAKVNFSEAQLGIIEMVKSGCDNKTMAERLGIKPTSLSALKSRTNKMLRQAKMSFESYPNEAL